MALIKFGSVVTDGSGKLGGHVFQNSKGGAQLRTKPIPTGKPSLSQISIRSINKALQKGWHDLTDAQRKVWNDWAVSHSIMTIRDPRKPISGHDLWMKYNYTWLAAGGSFLPDPSYWGGPILGPELVKNGGFNSAADWGVSPTWTISGGKAIYLATISRWISQTCPIVQNQWYRVVFDISDVITFARVLLYSYEPSYLFKAPLNSQLSLQNGHYSYTVQGYANTTLINFIGYTSGSTFKLDNWSIRKII